MSRALQLTFPQMQHIMMGIHPGMGARELGLTLLGKFSSKSLPFLSLFPSTNSEGAGPSELGRPQAAGCSGPWGGRGVVGRGAVCHFPGTSQPQGAWAGLCICHVCACLHSGACAPSSKLCSQSDSDPMVTSHTPALSGPYLGSTPRTL